MTDRISIKELRQSGEFWLRAGDVYTDNVLASHILALIDAVEAAQRLVEDAEDYDQRGSARVGGKTLADLCAALERFGE